MEGSSDHPHGLVDKYVLHERHGIGKARHGLENLNYKVEKVALLQGGDPLSRCAVLVVAGPKVGLLPTGGAGGAGPFLPSRDTAFSACSLRAGRALARDLLVLRLAGR